MKTLHMDETFMNLMIINKYSERLRERYNRENLVPSKAVYCSRKIWLQLSTWADDLKKFGFRLACEGRREASDGHFSWKVFSLNEKCYLSWKGLKRVESVESIFEWHLNSHLLFILKSMVQIKRTLQPLSESNFWQFVKRYILFLYKPSVWN